MMRHFLSRREQIKQSSNVMYGAETPSAQKSGKLAPRNNVPDNTHGIPNFSQLLRYNPAVVIMNDNDDKNSSSLRSRCSDCSTLLAIIRNFSKRKLPRCRVNFLLFTSFPSATTILFISDSLNTKCSSRALYPRTSVHTFSATALRTI